MLLTRHTTLEDFLASDYDSDSDFSDSAASIRAATDGWFHVPRHDKPARNESSRSKGRESQNSHGLHAGHHELRDLEHPNAKQAQRRVSTLSSDLRRKQQSVLQSARSRVMDFHACFGEIDGLFGKQVKSEHDSKLWEAYYPRAAPSPSEKTLRDRACAAPIVEAKSQPWEVTYEDGVDRVQPTTGKTGASKFTYGHAIVQDHAARPCKTMNRRAEHGVQATRKADRPWEVSQRKDVSRAYTPKTLFRRAEVDNIGRPTVASEYARPWEITYLLGVDFSAPEEDDRAGVTPPQAAKTLFAPKVKDTRPWQVTYRFDVETSSASTMPWSRATRVVADILEASKGEKEGATQPVSASPAGSLADLADHLLHTAMFILADWTPETSQDTSGRVLVETKWNASRSEVTTVHDSTQFYAEELKKECLERIKTNMKGRLVREETRMKDVSTGWI